MSRSFTSYENRFVPLVHQLHFRVRSRPSFAGCTGNEERFRSLNTNIGSPSKGPNVLRPLVIRYKTVPWITFDDINYDLCSPPSFIGWTEAKIACTTLSMHLENMQVSQRLDLHRAQH